MCEKRVRDQLIGKINCEGKDEGVSVYVCVCWTAGRVCVVVLVVVGMRRGVTGLVLSVGLMWRTMGAAGVGRVSHAFALWLGQQACATGVVSPPLACCPTRGRTGGHENPGPWAL